MPESVLSPDSKTTTFLNSARLAIRSEIQAIEDLEKRLDGDFSAACELLLHCKGRVVVMGMGKSGHIGRKMAATLASTGTPAFFVHPGEANHGDLGMITTDDVVIGISNSGQTEELVSVLPILKRQHIPLIAITGNPQSVLRQNAQCFLNIAVEKEACPLNLAPTSSTTVTLVLGDALAIALLAARGFTAEDFARSHPGGRLGKRLLVRIEDVMRKDEQVPVVSPDTSIRDALIEVSRVNLGITAVVDKNGHLAGVFSDGDLRRCIDKGIDLKNTVVESVMSKGGVTVMPSQLAAEALHIMETRHIHALLVVNTHQQVVGAFNIHDLFYHGVM